MRLFLLFLLTVLPLQLSAATYYVSSAGSDGAAGTSTGTAWATVAKVNSTATAGDTVYFRRGDRWRQGPIVVPASTLTYGAYGAGAAPIIDGSDLKTWTNTGGNVWTASVTDDPFFVMFGGATGTKEANAGAVNAAGEWFWTGGTLTVFHVGDPASVVEVPTREYGIVSQVGGSPRNTITIRDIEFRGARYYNIKNSSGNTWTVDNVIADHSGHGGVVFEGVSTVVVTNSRISYANQLGASAFHEALTVTGVNGFTISRNILFNNGEDGIDAKYNSSNGVISFNTVYNNGTGPSIYIDGAHDIVVSDNEVRDSAVGDKGGICLAVENFANPGQYDLTNITITRNTITNHAAGIWIWIEPGAEAFADISGIKIVNNTIANNNKTNWGGIFIFGDGTTANYGAGLEIRNNIIWNNAVNGGAKEIRDAGAAAVIGDFTIANNLFKTGSPTDTLGTASVSTTDVLFSGADYGIQSRSPARNAGVAVSGIGQVVYEGTPDIGAEEFQPNVALRQGAGWCRIVAYGSIPSSNITCQEAPGWPSGQLITTSNLPNATAWSPITGGTFYVLPVSTTQFRLFTDAGLTVAAPNPGTYPAEDGTPRWAGAATMHTADLSRPRFQEAPITRGWRCATASKTNIPVEGPACLTNIVVAAGEATATIPGGHPFAVGGGVGTFEFAEATMRRTDRVVTAITATTVKWAEPTAPSGTYTDGQVSAYAHNLNPQWTAVQEGCFYHADWDKPRTDTTSEQAERYLNCAIEWYVDHTRTTSKTKGKWIINNPMQMVYGSMSCNTAEFANINGVNYTNDYCGRGASGIDYGRGAAVNALRTYDLLMTDDSTFSPAEEQRFRDIVLNDFRDNPSAVYTPITFPAGTITVTGGVNITGVGTNFNLLAVGGVVWIKRTAALGDPARDAAFLSDIAHASIITNIADATHMTIAEAKPDGTYQQATTTTGDYGTAVWMYTRPWATTDIGMWGFFQHHKNTQLGSSLIYKSHTGQVDAVWQYNNLVITSQQFFVGAAIAFLGEDSRATSRLTEAWTMAADHNVAGAMSHLASGHPMGNNYTRGRGQYMYRTVTAMAKAFPTYPNMRGPWLWGINWTDIYSYNGGDYGRITTDQAYFGQTGEDAAHQSSIAFQSSLDHLQALPVNLQRGFKNMLQVFSPDGTFASYSGGLRAFHGFEGLNPQLTPLPDMSSFPLGLINDTTSRDLCVGLRWCRGPDYVYIEMVSRKDFNWNQGSVNIHIASGTSDQDHLAPSWDTWWINMGMFSGNQRCFSGTDDFDCARMQGYGEAGVKNGVYMARHSYEKYTGGIATVTYRASTNKLFAARSQFTQANQALYPDNDEPELAHRDYVRFLPFGGADDLFIVRTNLRTKPASVLVGGAPLGNISTYTHYGNNGETATAVQAINEGTTTCNGSTCAAGAVITVPIISTNTTSNYRMISNTVYPVSTRRGLRKTQLANGGYTGGSFGKTFRVETCATSDDATCTPARELTAIEVHKLTTSADATTLNLTPLAVGLWDGVQATGTSSTRVAMFIQVPTCQTSMGAVTTTATANVAAMGLCAGVYDLRRNGTPACNDVTVTSDGVLFCEGVAAGAIDIALEGAPPAPVDITTTSPLAAGTVGSAYTQSLSISGGTPPYTCALQSGTLPPGVTLNSNCTYSGTPTTAGTYVHTPQATDFASSVDPGPPSLSITINAPAGGTYYISALQTGTGGNGTLGSPWGLVAVLEQTCTGCSSIPPGSTFFLMDDGIHLIGRYGLADTPWRTTSISGTVGSPITFRSIAGARARVDGGVLINGDYTIWRGMEWFCSAPLRVTTTSGSFPPDIKIPPAFNIHGDGTQIIDNIVHTTGEIAAWEDAANVVIAENIWLYGGWQGPDRGHTHGFYDQPTAASPHTYKRNIVILPFDHGMQVYRSGVELSSTTLLNNVFINAGGLSSGGMTRSLLVGSGGVIASNMTLTGNYTWGAPTNLGYYGGSGLGCSNMQANLNYFVNPTASLAVSGGGGANGATCAFNGSTTGNVIYGPTQGITLPGSNTTLTAGTLPSTAHVFVHPSEYVSNKAMVVVYNWPDANNVSFEPTVLSPGDTYGVKDAQNPLGAAVAVGTYASAAIVVPTTSTTMATPAVTLPISPAGLHTPKMFNTFIVEKTGVSTVDITTTSLPSGTVGVGYSQTLAAANCSPCSWTIAGGSLPPGLTLSGATISGNPTTAGNFSITPQATVTATGAIDITPPSIPITIAASGGTGSAIRGTIRGTIE